jgi:hypothetical protein
MSSILERYIEMRLESLENERSFVEKHQLSIEERPTRPGASTPEILKRISDEINELLLLKRSDEGAVTSPPEDASQINP